MHCTTERPREHYARPNSAAGRTSNPALLTDAGGARDAAPADAHSGDDDSDSATPNVQPRDAALADAASSDASRHDGSTADAGAHDSVREHCGEPPKTAGAFSQEALRAAGADCAVWHYCAFQAVATELASAVEAYAQERSSAQLTAAREAFRRAMRVWSQAELFQFGPAASSAQSAGKDIYQGKGLRDRIYAWPATARCRVEEEIVEQTTDVSRVLISGRGLFALEYALFYEGSDTACASGTRVAADWASLSPEQVTERKLAYAVAVTKDLRAQIDALIAAWQPDGGNFRPQFVSASGYPNAQEALNVLGWALIYVEREVKDWKLGLPAGYTMTAPVTGPETPFARMGTEAIRANLRGFRALYQGCGSDGEGLGFDDWLEAVGHGELAREITGAYVEAQSTMDAFPALHEASPTQLDTAYQALRKLTSLLKGDLFGTGSPLNLKLPASVEGDTD